MANTSSAKKAIRVAEKKTAVNDVVRDKVKTARKQLEKAINAKSAKGELENLLVGYYKQIDKASKKGVNVLTQNKAARLKSRMAKKVTQSS